MGEVQMEQELETVVFRGSSPGDCVSRLGLRRALATVGLWV